MVKFLTKVAFLYLFFCIALSHQALLLISINMHLIHIILINHKALTD